MTECERNNERARDRERTMSQRIAYKVECLQKSYDTRAVSLTVLTGHILKIIDGFYSSANLVLFSVKVDMLYFQNIFTLMRTTVVLNKVTSS